MFLLQNSTWYQSRNSKVLTLHIYLYRGSFFLHAVMAEENSSIYEAENSLAASNSSDVEVNPN